jgi:Xaa-Pro dipeptidase
MTLAFTEQEFRSRTERAQHAVGDAGLDALIVTAPENICYLSGFATPGYHVFQALVLPVSSEPFLVVRNIESDNVAEHSWIRRTHLIHNLDTALETLADAMQAEGAARGRVGVEVDGARQSVTRTDLLGTLMPGVQFEPVEGLVEQPRAVKSEAEIAYIQQAVSMAEVALLAGAQAVERVATDSDVAAAVAGALASAGSEFTGSPSYVVGGPSSEVTHALHGRRALVRGEHVWLEVSASVNRYHGALSRIAGIDLPTETNRLFRASVAALEAMFDAARPGVTSGEVDAAGRAAAEAHGALRYWRNRAAYSLGLSFPPGLGEGHVIDIKPNDLRSLAAGMVFHFIPILKVPGVGAIGCTETVVVTEAGAQRLGELPLEVLDPTQAAQPYPAA